MKKKERALAPLRALRRPGVRGLAACYMLCAAVGLLARLCGAAVLFVGFCSGQYQQRSLTLRDFELHDVELLDDMTMVTTTDDTQLWLTGGVCNVMVKCSFSYDPGEFVLYYSYHADGAFSARRCVPAREIDGCYLFTLPPGVRQIRLDTGIFPSVTVAFEEITLNRCAANDLLRFSTEDLFWLLTVPCVLYAGADLAGSLPVRRRARVHSTV